MSKARKLLNIIEGDSYTGEINTLKGLGISAYGTKKDLDKFNTPDMIKRAKIFVNSAIKFIDSKEKDLAKKYKKDLDFIKSGVDKADKNMLKKMLDIFDKIVTLK